MLSSLWFFDVDSQDLETVDKISGFMKERGHVPAFPVISSGRGLHVYFREKEGFKMAEKPNERLINYIKMRKVYKQQMLKENISNVDFNVLIDPKRVSRMVGTKNKGNTPCKFLKQGEEVLVSQTTAMTEPSPINKTRIPAPNEARGVSSPKLLKSLYLTNIVFGAKNRGIFYSDSASLKDMKRLQDDFKLGTFFYLDSKGKKKPSLH
jgi:hypothetical protein